MPAIAQTLANYLLPRSHTQSDPLYTWLPFFARLVFAAVLLVFFVNSAITKFDGVFTPSAGAFVQIFPTAFEEAGYNEDALPGYMHIIALIGGWAEFVLPVLVVIGLFTRPAALGLIGFTIVMSLVDIYGHGVDAKTIGGWFDNLSGAAILDQRLLWMLLFVQLLVMGGGKLSLDYLIQTKLASRQT